MPRVSASGNMPYFSLHACVVVVVFRAARHVCLVRRASLCCTVLFVVCCLACLYYFLSLSVEQCFSPLRYVPSAVLSHHSLPSPGLPCSYVHYQSLVTLFHLVLFGATSLSPTHAFLSYHIHIDPRQYSSIRTILRHAVLHTVSIILSFSNWYNAIRTL